MTNPTISPLRRRMVDDMTIRGFASKTQRGYIGAVKNFAAFLGRSPDRACGEDLRRDQLHMRSAGASATSMNTAVSGLRFFFGVTLGRDDAAVGMTGVREPRTLPVVLSPRRSRACWMRQRASSTRQRCLSPTAPACAPRRWSRSNSPTSTAPAR